MEKVVIFIALVFCVGINAKSCKDRLLELKGQKKLLGAFKPKCQPNGKYEETQCHENYCYCVIPETGEEILGTKVRGARPKSCKATKCLLQRHEVLSKGPLVGAFQPQCEEDGSFKKVQCHASTGYCFCVIPESGEKIYGTELRFKQPTTCELTPCIKERHNVLKVQPRLLGAFVPKCKPDGSYEEVQCQEGFCFCVFPETGKEIMGTRLIVRGQIPKTCKQTPCIMERHKVLNSPRPLLGAFRPQCNEDGSYKKVQCKEGYCYCVFENGKPILGTKSNIRGVVPSSCEITPCVLKRHKGWSMSKWGLLGAPITRCDANGKYSKLQCRKGLCWCVDQDTGKPVGKTAQWVVPNCD